MVKYPNLFSPIQVGNILFRNRIFFSATGHLDLKKDNTLSDDALLYYERRAVGGAAQVCIGSCEVDPVRGARGGPCIDMSDFNSLHYLSRLVDYVSRHGSVASPELCHAGMYANSMPGMTNPIYGPSDCEVEGRICRAMPEKVIEETIEAFANAAFFAKMCGFKMVTVHGGHGWLLQQFFSPYTNKRTDKWGGSAENRARLAVAVCDAIHRKCGSGFPVEMRISATEFEDGYDVEEGIEYAKQLEGHADIIHVSVGIHGSLMGDSWLKFSPTMFADDGVNVKFAAEIKKHVKTTPIVAIGALTDPAMMEEIIASGKADFVALARGLLCDPDLPNKARDGREDEIRKCIRCMSCWSGLMNGQIYCALNPETSREHESKFGFPPAEKKTVLVAGGGISGMQAALTASNCGHKVILCEKSGHLGGRISCEENVPFKKHVREYIQLQERLVSRAPIDLRLNTEVTPELAESLRPDVIIAALGARPAVPKIKGIDGPNVMAAEEAYIDPEKVGKKAVILGAGLVGTELAVYLSMLGHDVEIVEMLGQINAEGNMTQGMVVGGQLRDRGIRVRFNTKALEITDQGVVCEGPDGEKLLEADTVIYATGQKPLTDEAVALNLCAPRFYMIGDCLGPNNIINATKTAYTIAKDIGRH
ncbi:MAG: FAD-dependent oxidoreductase [Eubacteriales bacterium]|jgi:2,4-dienoyl-CoA reductase-like NADH-dependent reductase (Old Yellow Enzyme family)/thioredoxin reductase|nr:FAD-dependent oxidoreductase [Eubacteriales bacterium]